MVYDGVIEGVTVRMRSIEERDAEATFAMRSDAEKSRYVHGARGTVEDQRAFIRDQRERVGDWLFVVEDLCGKPIGMKGIYGLSDDGKTVESGRLMNFGSQAQGVEALCLGFDFAFGTLGVETVVMSVLSENSNMRGIQGRIGARVMRSEYNPEFGCDSIWSELSREDWERSRPRLMRLIGRFAGR